MILYIISYLIQMSSSSLHLEGIKKDTISETIIPLLSPIGNQVLIHTTPHTHTPWHSSCLRLPKEHLTKHRTSSYVLIWPSPKTQVQVVYLDIPQVTSALLLRLLWTFLIFGGSCVPLILLSVGRSLPFYLLSSNRGIPQRCWLNS